MWQKASTRLGLSCIDLFYQHRPPNHPDPALRATVEETVDEMEQLRKEGKVKYIGLCEYGVDEIRRAAKVAKIDAYQIEVSERLRMKRGKALRVW
jgi:aryl-alcohol dehydrogenase-like predicted oxidoreductase